jgi:tRNA modification GTPase
LAGGLARPLHELRSSLVDLLAHLEAGFDFADEDLPFITQEELQRRLLDARQLVATVLRQMASRGEAADEVRIALAGCPNVGKSSLFNAMLGDRSQSALVSATPGTTRDYLDAELDLAGVPCRWIDTAGMASGGRQPPVCTPIDLAAQKVAAEQHESAHLRVLCLDSTRPMNDWERDKLQNASHNQKTLVVLTKCDAPRTTDCRAPAIETSSRTGRGLDLLRAELRRRAIDLRAGDGDVVASTVVRCRDSLDRAAESLRVASDVAAAGQEELAAAEIRGALDALGMVVGEVYTDDVLDRIFSQFCVGK